MSEQMANSISAMPSLFPILDQTAGAPAGLARLAQQAETAGQRHEVTFKDLPVRSLLNKTFSHRGLSLAYSINPYRGCEFACRYCYARYTHQFFAGSAGTADGPDFQDPELFERLIFLKSNAAWLLEQELRTFPTGEEIAIGTATDPYQPVERSARITRSILEVFAKRSGHHLSIITKSDLILRDADLLARIAERNRLVVHLTVTTVDSALARKLEPRAPRPDLRLGAVRELRARGLQVGVLCSPLLPGITDSLEHLYGMASLAAKASASFFSAEPLFLKPCSRPTYLSFVEEHYPHLLASYQRQFENRAFTDSSYHANVRDRVERACRRYRLPHRSMDALVTRAPNNRKPPTSTGIQQARLFA